MTIKTIYTEITNRCNLNCRTCYNRSGLNRRTEELPPEKLRSIIEFFSGMGMKRFLLSGGEPTLHSRFDETLDLVDEYPDISFGIVTNGTNHNEKLIRYLNEGKNITLQVSLDGSCEEQNSKTRGAGNFARTMEFVRKIKTPKTKPLLKMVISQDNYGDIEDFYRMALSEGFIPELAFIYKYGNGSDSWEDKCLSPKQKYDALMLIRKLNKECGADAFLPLCTIGCPYAGPNGGDSLCIKVNGDIQPCQSLYGSKYTVGNIDSFDKEALGRNLEQIHSIAKERSKKDFGCIRCIRRDSCKHGCIAEAENICGDPLGDDGQCEYRRMQFVGFELKGAFLNQNEQV